jgi:hypothetical protein
MLSSALPSISTSASSTIVSDKLPDLRSLVLVDNIGTGDRFEAALAQLKCTVDYRELFMWQQSTAEDKHINELSQIFTKDDVINLQFTRFSCISFFQSAVAD